MNDTLMLTDFDIEENYYRRVYDDMVFFHEMLEQERDMEEYVNEHIILASGNRKAINEMVALNEGKITEKIKGFFTKIKNFFQAIFRKLGERLNGWLMDVKKYMDKYAEIINKRKYIAGDVTMKDHFKGYTRITNTINNPKFTDINTMVQDFNNKNSVKNTLFDNSLLNSLSTADAINKYTITEQDQNAGAVIMSSAVEIISSHLGLDKDNEFTVVDNSDGTVNIYDTFGNYYNGSAEDVTFSVEQINTNFKYIINTTYAGPDILKKIQNIANNYATKLDDLAKSYEAAYNKIENALKAAIAKTAAEAEPAPTPKKESVNYTRYRYNNYLNEADGIVNTSTGKKPEEKMNKEAGKDDKKVLDTATQNLNKQNVTNVSKVDTSKTTVTGVTAGKEGPTSKDALTDKVGKILTSISSKTNVEITSFAQAMNQVCISMNKSFEKTCTDYYAILKAHVRSYLNASNNTPENNINRGASSDTRPAYGVQTTKDSSVETKPKSTPATTATKVTVHQRGSKRTPKQPGGGTQEEQPQPEGGSSNVSDALNINPATKEQPQGGQPDDVFGGWGADDPYEYYFGGQPQPEESGGK